MPARFYINNTKGLLKFLNVKNRRNVILHRRKHCCQITLQVYLSSISPCVYDIKKKCFCKHVDVRGFNRYDRLWCSEKIANARTCADSNGHNF